MSTPAEVLEALDFPTPCTATNCPRPATTAWVTTHMETWEPCISWPLCAVHATALARRLNLRSRWVCHTHHLELVYRMEAM